MHSSKRRIDDTWIARLLQAFAFLCFFLFLPFFRPTCESADEDEAEADSPLRASTSLPSGRCASGRFFEESEIGLALCILSVSGVSGSLRAPSDGGRAGGGACLEGPANLEGPTARMMPMPTERSAASITPIKAFKERPVDKTWRFLRSRSDGWAKKQMKADKANGKTYTGDSL